MAGKAIPRSNSTFLNFGAARLDPLDLPFLNAWKVKNRYALKRQFLKLDLAA
ncbi:MAG: hypothetical protein LC768_05950 [Acidobacteria bacterium]|nr:hypothetical protein [Acidobacteriota bacterium]MCA1637866.1 hypothetical protein [Acidobacteriota bacterium]